MELHEWLTKTTAAEVMVRDVVTLDPHNVLAQAAGLFLHRQISGAPVVDVQGIRVGVLSISDIIGAEEKVAEERQEVAQSSFWQSNLALPASLYEEKLAQVRDKIAPAAQQPVSHFMTTDLVSVRGDASLGTVIGYMVDAHLHRVVVVDRQKRLEGIIGTTDVLAALVRQAGD